MPSNGSSSHSGESYDLGGLVDEYPVNTRGMINSLIWLAGLATPILIAGVNFWINGLRLFDELTLPDFFLFFFFIIFTLFVGYTLIQVILQGKPWFTILSSDSTLYANLNIGLILLMLAAAFLILFRPGMGMVVTGVVSTLWAMGLVLSRMRRLRGQVIREFEQGIVVPVDGEPVPIRWDQIDTLFLYGSEGRIGRYSLPPVEIEGYWLNSRRLLAQVQGKVHERLYNDMLEHFNAGKVVNFGKIRLDRQGISCNTARYSWEEIDQVCLSNENISVRRGSRFHALPGVTIKDIPNLNSFLALTSQILSPTKTEAETLPEPEVPAAATPLDKVREHRPDPRQLFMPAIWLTVGLLILLPILFIASPTEIRMGNSPIITFVVICGVTILGALWKFAAWLRCIGVRVSLSEDALTYTRSGESVVLNWGDIQTIKIFYVRSWRSVLVYRYTLVSKNGRVIHLRQGLKDMDGLGDYMAKQMNINVSPQLAKRVENGELVRFGRWGISRQGIHDRDRTLPWDQIGDIIVKARAVLVRQKGQPGLWTRIPIMGTPNLWVFLNLAGRYTKSLRYELAAFRAS